MKISALELFELFGERIDSSIRNYANLTVNATADPQNPPHYIYRTAGVAQGLNLAKQILDLIREEVRDKDEFGIEDDKDE